MRTKLILFLAIAMSLITTFILYTYLKKYDTEKILMEKTVDVVMAKQPIKKNQKLTSSEIEITQVPLKGMQPNAVRKLSLVDGAIATADIEKGETILKHHIQKESESKLVARKVREGNRAVSINVEFAQSVSNLIEPEDYVDVLFSEKVKKDDTTKTVLLLPKVRVLTVGKRMTESKDSKEASTQYKTVTLEVRPEDEIALVNAQERGKLYLSLCGTALQVNGREEK